MRRRTVARALHRIGRLLQLLRRFREFGRVLLTRQPLQAPRFFFRLLCHFALTTATTTRTRLFPQFLTHRISHALHAVVFLLLALGELLQAIQRLINFLLCLLLLCLLLLHRFVLIAQLVNFEREQVSEIFRFLLCAAATTAATLLLLAAHLHLHIAIQRFGTLQMLQGLLFWRQRITHPVLHQLFFRTLHRNNGRVEFTRNQREQRVRAGDHALLDTTGQAHDILTQTPLRNVDGRDIIAALASFRTRAVTQPVECAGHNFFLTRNETIG